MAIKAYFIVVVAAASKVVEAMAVFVTVMVVNVNIIVIKLVVFIIVKIKVEHINTEKLFENTIKGIVASEITNKPTIVQVRICKKIRVVSNTNLAVI